MKVRCLALAAIALTLSAGLARAAEKAKPSSTDKPKANAPAAAPAAPAMDEAAMQAMQKAMTPGPQHQHLAKMAGDWTFTNTFWMAPGAPPQQSTGTMHAEMMLGGRYLDHHWTGSFMGQPFEGRGTEAYDNVAKQFMSTWIDNMGTGMMVGTGTCNDAMSSCNYQSEMWDPMTGKKTSTRQVITWMDDNTFKNEMYGPGPDGKEMKMMEIVAKRKTM